MAKAQKLHFKQQVTFNFNLRSLKTTQLFLSYNPTKVTINYVIQTRKPRSKPGVLTKASCTC